MEHRHPAGRVYAFICDICGNRYENKPPYNQTSRLTSGYGTNQQGQIVCYPCCAKQDKADMVRNGKIVLYLTHETEQKPNVKQLRHFVSNWPGSLKIHVRHIKIGRHNIAGRRYDVWFVFDGFWWWGVTYGDNTQLCHCKQTKQAV